VIRLFLGLFFYADNTEAKKLSRMVSKQFITL